MSPARVPSSKLLKPYSSTGSRCISAKRCLLIQNMSSDHQPASEIPLRFRLGVSDLDYYFAVTRVLQMNQLWPPAIIVLCLSMESAAGEAASCTNTLGKPINRLLVWRTAASSLDFKLDRQHGRTETKTRTWACAYTHHLINPLKWFLLYFFKALLLNIWITALKTVCNNSKIW